MLRLSQLHGFNVIPDSATAPTSPGGPDHAWRFYGVPASMEDAVASADFNSFGSPATGTGINNQCLVFGTPAQYLTEDTAIGSGGFTVSGWAKPSINDADESTLSPILITEDGSTNYMDIHLDYQTDSGRWRPVLHWNTTDTEFTGADLDDAEWFFFALSLDGSQNVKGHINLIEMTHSDPMIGNGDEIRVNTASGGTIGGYPTLAVDEIYCWGTALSAANKAWLFNGGAGRFVDGAGQF